MIRNIRNILKLNTRICKRFSTNSEHETVLSGIKDCKNEKLLLSIKDDLLKNNIEINNIKVQLNDSIRVLDRTFTNTCIASIAGAGIIGHAIGSWITNIAISIL
jgi:hypothetical protein